MKMEVIMRENDHTATASMGEVMLIPYNNGSVGEEVDPTVPDWAKQPQKPAYTAEEVGAVATVNGISPDKNGNVEIGGASVEGALLYTPQTLTEEQKAQACENIGAASEDDLNDAVAELEDKIASGGTGDVGATFIPYVSVDGIISWTNDKNLPNPDPVNIKGGKGDPGANGKDGYTPVKGVDYFDGQQGEKGDPFTYEDFTPEQLASLKGDPGVSGVYVGSGDMPDGYNIQIDPEGSGVESLVLSVNGIEPDGNGNVEIGGVSVEGAVLYTPQTLTEEQKAQARANIGAGGGSAEGAVQIDDTLTKEGFAADAKAVGDALGEKVDKVEILVEVGTKTDGKYRQSNGAEYSVTYGNYLTVVVSENEQYLVTGTNVSSDFPFCLVVDENGQKVFSIVEDGNVIHTDEKIIIPQNGVRMFVNGQSSKSKKSASAFRIEWAASERETNEHIKWIGAGERVDDHYVSFTNNKITPATFSGYSYSVIDYDYNNPVRLRFTGYCADPSFPILFFGDEYNNFIGELYNVTGDLIDKQEVEIPKGTKKIYCQSRGSVNHSNTNLIEIAVPTDVKNVDERIGILLGDSIVQGVGVLPTYSSVFHDFIPRSTLSYFIEQYSGYTIYNGGLGGGCTGERTIDFQKVADCIASGDFSDIQSGITQYELNKFASANWDRISALDFNNVDFIAIGYGYNDWNSGRTEEQIKTGLRYGLNKILTKYPHLKIYLFTPTYYLSDDGTKDSDVYANTTSGLYLYQVVEYIEDIAKEYHIPCKNLYYSGNINAFNAPMYMNGSPHRNAKGYDLLGYQWAGFLMSN